MRADASEACVHQEGRQFVAKIAVPAANQKVMVACDGDIIIGYACILLNDDAVFGSLLDNLHVATSWQGTGTGTILIKSAARFIYETASEKKFYLWVLEQNFKARKFYEKLGGKNYETILMPNPDGITSSPTCRYVWMNIDELAELSASLLCAAVT